MADYHDNEWGVPLRDERRLFEFLSLEGAQAGLSWTTILAKRENYLKNFYNFDPERVARFNKRKVERLLSDPGIVRNRLKVESVVNNAKIILTLREEYGDFGQYVWSFTNHKTIHNAWKKIEDIPAATQESARMSKDMKKRGFRFVGPTTLYAFMQAVGMANDHLVTCYRYGQIKRMRSKPKASS